MTRTALKKLLEELGMRPNKGLGQNYMCDENLARWIGEQAKLQPHEHLVEIGPGLGALTEYLLPEEATEARPGGATLIEFDRTAAAYIAKRFGEQPGVELLQEDAVKFGYKPLFARGPVVLVSNLPYKGGGMMLMNAAEWPTPVVRMVVMLQLEVAQRLASAPGQEEYGALTVLLGYHWKARFLRKISPQVFFPEPGVDSAVIALEPRAFGELPVCREVTFRKIVEVGFSQRRKQLVKLLKGWRDDLDWAKLVGYLGVGRQVRAEELSIQLFCRLAALADPPPGMNKPAQSPESEIFDVVDEVDNVTHSLSRGEVHAQGLRHRAVHMFLRTERGEIFLQRRSPLKDRCPSLWDSSAAGHVDSGESYEVAAVRELEEELGVTGVELKEIGRVAPCEATGQEFVRLYLGDVVKKKHLDLRWPPAEIESGDWFAEALIDEWTANRPQDFAPGFLECWKVWKARPE